jgi:hypothetical protein
MDKKPGPCHAQNRLEAKSGQIGERKDFSSVVEFLSMRRVNKRYEKHFIENHRGGVCRCQSAPGRRARG